MENQDPPKEANSGLAVKVAVVFVLILAVAGAVALKKTRGPAASPAAPQAVAPPTAVASPPAAEIPKAPRPRMAEFGSDKCIPCKAMAPILNALSKEYAGSLEVSFTDVMKDREAGFQQKIEVIPTQIFFDPTGKEIFRHEGFFAKEDILAKWKELGYELKAETANAGNR